MITEINLSIARVRAFGIIENDTESAPERVVVQIHSIKDVKDGVLIKVSLTNPDGTPYTEAKGIEYSPQKVSPEEATFVGWACILQSERGGFFSNDKITEKEKKYLRDKAQEYLEIATRESKDYPYSEKKSCLPYYLVAKHKLFEHKDSMKTNLYKSLDCKDVFPDAYKVLIDFESYSVKKVLYAKEGLKKFPDDETLIYEIAKYHAEHNEHKKAVEIIKKHKLLIPDTEWGGCRSLRTTLIFSLLALGLFDEARQELETPIANPEIERDTHLFFQGLVEYEAKNYKQAIEKFSEVLSISSYESSDVRASLYFLLGCYDKLAETSKLEELVREFKPENDYLYLDGLAFDYTDYARGILKSILKSDISEIAKAKTSGLLAYSYHKEIESNQLASKNRESIGRKLTKKERLDVRKCISLLAETSSYYPRSSFFNALRSEFYSWDENFDEATKFDLKALDRRNDEDTDLFSSVELSRCSATFLKEYARHTRANVGDIDRYIEERLGSDIKALKEAGRHDTISELYSFIREKKDIDALVKAENESYESFLFDIAYSLNENGDLRDAAFLYKTYLKLNKDSSAALNNLSIIYEKGGELKKAQDMIKRAKKCADENDEIVNRNYARLVQKKSHSEQAESLEQEEEGSNVSRLPETFIEKGVGYFKFNKQSKKIKVGGENTRHFRLLHFLCNPIETSRTVDSVFEAIKLSKDANDSALASYNQHQANGRKLDLIDFAKKELQKIDGLKSRLKFEHEKRQKTYRLKIL